MIEINISDLYNDNEIEQIKSKIKQKQDFINTLNQKFNHFLEVQVSDFLLLDEENRILKLHLKQNGENPQQIIENARTQIKSSKRPILDSPVKQESVMPKIFEYQEITISLCSNNLDPVEFHAQYNENIIKMSFLIREEEVYQILYTNVVGKFPTQKKQDLKKFVNKYKNYCLRYWEQFFLFKSSDIDPIHVTKDFRKIAPLPED